MEDIYRRLSQPRPSLSPSQFSEGAFEDFQDQNGAASSEQDVMTDVIPTNKGRAGTKLHKAGDTLFYNLVKFAPGIADAKPDGYDGARPEEIDPAVRNHLTEYIIPSTSTRLLAAPNHLTEVKGPSGRSDVLGRQAMYAGAIGGRAMWELQNYGSDTPIYDGKAYTFVPTYHSGEGSLRVYATHPTQSATGRTEYHMTQLGSYALTHSLDTFRQGATAFRNSRDFSKEQRDRFIAAANATAAQRPAPVATPSSGTAAGVLPPQGRRAHRSSRTQPLISLHPKSRNLRSVNANGVRQTRMPPEAFRVAGGSHCSKDRKATPHLPVCHRRLALTVVFPSRSTSSSASVLSCSPTEIEVRSINCPEESTGYSRQSILGPRRTPQLADSLLFASADNQQVKVMMQA